MPFNLSKLKLWTKKKREEITSNDGLGAHTPSHTSLILSPVPRDSVKPNNLTTGPEQGFPATSNLFTRDARIRSKDSFTSDTSHVSSRAIEMLSHTIIPGASFDSADRYPPPNCHPKSRKSLRERVCKLLTDERSPCAMLWITGPAGVGKSAVAQTLAEHFEYHGRLGAALFFSSHGRDDISRAIPTLAYQLALHSSDYERFLARALDKGPRIPRGDLHSQFKKLIVEPIRSSIAFYQRMVIILDGLDECRDQTGQIGLIRLIKAYIRSYPNPNSHPFMWIICSRSEPHLKQALSKVDTGVGTYCVYENLSIDDTETTGDVGIVLRHGFHGIRYQYRHMFDNEERWPTKIQLRQLEHASSGYFMFLSCILRFIADENCRDPRAQLEICLAFIDNPSVCGIANPFHALDLLYQQILSNIHPTTLPITMRILGLWAFSAGDLTVQGMMNTLNLDRHEFYIALLDLHAVLYVPPPENTNVEGLRSYHSSFRDFLRYPNRSGRFTMQAVLPNVLDPLLDGRDSSTNFETSNNEQLLKTLSDVLCSQQKRKALIKLRGERAQLMIDFLDLVLLQPNISIPWLRKHTTIVLYQLCKDTELYPQCYVMQGIDISDTREDGGAFSDIFRGHKDGQMLCLKIVRSIKKSASSAMLKVYAKEAILWGHLDHPNIAPFYGAYYLDEACKQVCLVSPWMGNGNIVTYLENNPDAPREPFIYDIALGLEYLHTESLVHSDLKGLNILVNDLGRACITDFGMSFLRTDRTLAYTIGATTVQGCSYRWAAPELVEEDGHSTLASDMWAFGCVCFEILTGLLPFHECRTDSEIILRLLRGKLPSGSKPVEALAGVDRYMCELMNRCWGKELEVRPSCREIVEELESKGIARKAVDEAQDDMVYCRRRFQAAMGKNTDMSVDLTKVKELFDEL